MSVTGFGASVLRVKEDLMYECSEGCMGPTYHLSCLSSFLLCGNVLGSANQKSSSFEKENI